jgi:hypothetical protein
MKQAVSNRYQINMQPTKSAIVLGRRADISEPTSITRTVYQTTPYNNTIRVLNPYPGPHLQPKL